MPAGILNHPCDPRGKVGKGKVPTHDLFVPREKALVRPPQETVELAMGAQVEPSEPECCELPGNWIGSDGERAGTGRGLERRVAKALPGGGQDHCVGGCVEIENIGRGCRSRTGGRPVDNPHRRMCEESLELRTVAVLRWTEQPVNSVQCLGQLEASGDVLPLQRSGRLQQQPLTNSNAESLAGSRPLSRSGVRIKGVVDGGGCDSTICKLAPAQLVDRDVHPCLVVHGTGEPRELLTLPREVVVAQYGPPRAQRPREQPGCGHIERQRAHVLDDNEVRPAQGRSHLSARRRLRRPDRQALQHVVRRTLPRYGERREPERAKCSLPLRGLDGHPVWSTEPERHDACGRDNGTLPCQPWGAGRGEQRTKVRDRTVTGYGRSVTSGSSSAEILYEVCDGVARLTINRPDRRNALTWDAIRTLRSRVADAKADPLARVVVLAGAGDKAFCAGADLSGMAPDTGFIEAHDARGELASLMSDLWDLGKPTIARVQGFALAGGFGLALTCDMIVASTNATFGAPEVNVGLWPYMITVPILRSMPPKKALELMITGRTVGASEAEQIGFLTKLVSPDELDQTVTTLAQQVASKSPTILRLGRDSFYRVLDMSTREALAHLQAMLTLTTMTEDAAEGIAAFMEKRPPHWK